MNKKAYIKHGIRSHILALHKQANTEEAAPTAAPTKTEKKPGLISRTKEKVKGFVGDATLDAGVRRVRKGAEDAWSYAKKHPEVSIPGGAALVAAPFLYKWMRGSKQQVPVEQKQASATPDYLDAESRANVDRANEILGIGSNGFKDKLRDAFATAKGYGSQGLDYAKDMGSRGVDYAKGMGSRGVKYVKENPGEAAAIGAGGAALVAAPFLYKWMRGSKQQVPAEQKQASTMSIYDIINSDPNDPIQAARVNEDSKRYLDAKDPGWRARYNEMLGIRSNGFKDKLRDAFATAKGYGRQGVDYAKNMGSRGVAYAKANPGAAAAIGTGSAALVAAPFLYKWMRGSKQQVPVEQKQASATPDYLDPESRANVDRANEILGIGSNGFKDKLRQAFATAKGYGRQGLDATVDFGKDVRDLAVDVGSRGVDYAKDMGSRGVAYAKANPGKATAIGAGGAAIVAAPYLYKWMRGSKQQVPAEQKHSNKRA